MESTRPVISFERVYCDFAPAIRRRIAFFIKDSGAAEDICQEVFVKVWKSISTYDSSRGAIYTWLNSITVATCIDNIRRSKRRPCASFLDLTVDHLFNAQSHIDGVDLRTDMHRLFVKLAPCLHDVVVAIYLRGHTQKEAAEVLNLPLGTVKTRQRRALETMRRLYLH